nr:hypothetical protein [Pandoravirus aubagnensis]
MDCACDARPAKRPAQAEGEKRRKEETACGARARHGDCRVHGDAKGGRLDGKEARRLHTHLGPPLSTRTRALSAVTLCRRPPPPHVRQYRCSTRASPGVVLLVLMSFVYGASPFGVSPFVHHYGVVATPTVAVAAPVSYGVAAPTFGAVASPISYGVAAPTFGAVASPLSYGVAAPTFGAVASPISYGVATPTFGVATPTFGVATPTFGVATPAFGAVATSAFGVATPAFGAVAPVFGASRFCC